MDYGAAAWSQPRLVVSNVACHSSCRSVSRLSRPSSPPRRSPASSLDHDLVVTRTRDLPPRSSAVAMALRLSSRAHTVADADASDATPSAGTAVAGGRRAATTLLDQGFSSVSNFAVGVAVARVAGVAGLGAFAFAYAGWLVLADLHRALITDPMAIEGDVRGSGASRGIQRGFAAEVLLGSGATVLFALLGAVLTLVHARTFGTGMLCLAPWLPLLLVQDYWRWVSFMSQQPRRALANDTVFIVVQGAAFVAIVITHVHSVAAVITAWGLGGAAGAIYGLRQQHVVPSLRGGLSLLRSRWRMSKWLVGTSLTGWGSSQAYVYVAGAILGPAGLGGLKAAQTLVAGPAGVLIQAGGSIGLPEASKAHAERGWGGLVKVSRVVSVAGVMSFAAGALVVVVWGRALLSRLYGPQFAHLELPAVLIAVAYIFMGMSVGPVLVLKTTRNAHRIFYIQVATLVVSLAAVTGLSLRYGVTGAAVATIATYMTAAAGARWYQYLVRRSGADEPARPPAEPLPTTTEIPRVGAPPRHHGSVEGGPRPAPIAAADAHFAIGRKPAESSGRIRGKFCLGTGRNRRRRAGGAGDCRSCPLDGGRGQAGGPRRRRQRPAPGGPPWRSARRWERSDGLDGRAHVGVVRRPRRPGPDDRRGRRRACGRHADTGDRRPRIRS